MPADRAVFYGSRDLHEPRQSVIEEMLITFAEIILPTGLIFVQADSVFHTAAAADIEVSAYEAFVT